MEDQPDLNEFIDLGWLDGQRGVTVASKRRQRDHAETEVEVEIEGEVDRSPTDSLSFEFNGKSKTNLKKRPNGYKIPDDPDQLKTDFDKAVYNWNVTAEAIGLPVIQVMNTERKRRLKARLDEVGIAGWNKALEVLENDSFAKGLEDGKWKATFDFFLQPTSLAKMIEGGYRDE